MTKSAISFFSLLRGLLSSLLLSALFLHSGHALAQETCERTGIEFGFFNGVKTTLPQAQEVARDVLPEQYGRTTPDGQPISCTLYYNDTEGWADFVETFEQRLQEHNGVLSQRFELFFSSLQGGGSWWSHITETVPALGDVLTGIVQTFQAFLTNRLVEGTGDPSTAAVSQRHREQIDHAVAMDKGLLLFAHSQGNLFANQAYDHALTRVGADSVRVVHVAPPSPRQIGNYTLANLDVVINALRATGFVLPNSQTILPYAHRPPGLNGQRDVLGHGLLEIYLNPLVPSTSAAIRLHVEQALEALRSPQWSERPPYPEFVERPWTGGPRPTEQVTPGSVSHSVESWTTTRRGPHEDPNNGYRFERVLVPGTDWVVWANRNRRAQFTYDGVGYTSERSTVVRGQGVTGNMQCRRSVAGQCNGVGAVMTTESECNFDRFLTNLPHVGNWSFSIDELLSQDNSPVGTVVHIDQATSRPTVDQVWRFERRFTWYPPQFLSGRRHVVTEWRGVPGFYDNTYYCSPNKLIDENTLAYATEAFVATPATVRNLEEIRRWHEAHDQWRTTERRRWMDHQARWQAWLNWRATCIRPPPPPSDLEQCTPEQFEDPDVDCLRPS